MTSEEAYLALVRELRFQRGGVATLRERREAKAKQRQLAMALQFATGTQAHIWLKRARKETRW